MKKILTFVALTFALLSSCKKELQPISSNSGSKTTVAAPKISNAAIANWFVKNPAGAYITPDWTKARQITLSGVDVVTVPIKYMITPPSSGIQTAAKQAAV